MAPDSERIDELLDGITGKTTKADLRARLAELATAVAEHEHRADSTGAPAIDPKLIPIAYHVTGAEHRGTQVVIHRCTPRGPSADLWVVQAGRVMHTREGHPMKAIRWHQQTAALRARTGMPFDEAEKLARSLR